MATIGKGVFTRSRFDFLVQNGMIGGSHVPTVTHNNNARVALVNTDSAGRPIACYAVMPYCPSNPPLVLGATLKTAAAGTVATGATGGVNAVFPSGAIQPGIIEYWSVGAIGDEWTNIFFASGLQWVHLGGAPIAVIPVGYMFALWPQQLSSDLYCSFLWGCLEDKAAGAI